MQCERVLRVVVTGKVEEKTKREWFCETKVDLAWRRFDDAKKL
jgi:hypothetical protein